MPSRRALLLSSAAVLALAAVGVGLAGTGDGIPRGTTVRAVEVGGLSRAEAVSRLSTAFDTEQASSVSLVADGEVLQLDQTAAGLTLDVDATVDEALDVGFLDRLRTFVGAGRDVDPVPAVDEAALTASLTALAEGFDRAAREGSISFSPEAEPVPEAPVTGRALDVAGAADAVVEDYLSLRVEVPVELDEVSTTDEAVREALEQVAEPAVAAPITVDVEGDELVLEPVDLAPALTITAVDGELAPQLDGAVLREQLTGRLERVGVPAVDATFDISSGAPVVVPSQPGRSVSAEDLRTAVLSVLTDEAPRRAAAPLSASAPRLPTEEAAGLGVVEVLGSYTSAFPCCQPRVTNIQTIADIVDGHVLKPGEQFDLNAFVGPRDTARGFVSAPQILRGEFVNDVGGGVSQFATALFNGYFFAGLKDITHSPHSYYISRYPPGREATVSFPLPDLIFENDSPNGVLIDTSYTGTSITVTMWGTKRFEEVRSVTEPRTRVREAEVQYIERPDCIAGKGGEGFDVVVTRVFVAGGREVTREDFTTRYLPQPKFVCGPPPRTAAPPPAAPAPAPAEP
ncbi:MAG: VanW family protein, partial [Frankiaceae bacterium]|nr:VanW family protein [Frankiaceae bacterium]